MHLFVQVFLKKVTVIVVAWIHSVQRTTKCWIFDHLQIIQASICSQDSIVKSSLRNIHSDGWGLGWGRIWLRTLAWWNSLGACSWQANMWMLTLECSQDLLALSLSLSSLLSALLRSLAKLLSISLLALSNLIAEVERSQTIYETILILEALLCHIKRLLHCHCEGNAKSEDEADEQ